MSNNRSIEKTSILMGVDPGWANLGWAMLFLDKNQEFDLLATGVDRPKDSGADYPEALYYAARDVVATSDVTDGFRLDALTIERYVPYNNTFTAEAENITMLIGGLREVFRQPIIGSGTNFAVSEVGLVRAIEWKTALVKLLAKYMGFDNPSTSLDKKFSMAAANHILKGKYEIETDHEADAICLAALPALLKRYASRA